MAKIRHSYVDLSFHRVMRKGGMQMLTAIRRALKPLLYEEKRFEGGLNAMRRRRQADYRYLQAKYELTLNDEDEIDFNIQAMRRPMIIGRTKCNHWS